MSASTPSTEGLEEVLTKIGRASTPQVPQNVLNLSLPRILGTSLSHGAEKNFYGVVSYRLADYLNSKRIDFTSATPGLSHQILSNTFSGTVLIDRAALTEGPWFGTLAESSINLREEVYELCRTARQNGVPVWFLDCPVTEQPFSVIRIQSACDVVFPYSNIEDFEEQAKLSADFACIMSFVNARFELED